MSKILNLIGSRPWVQRVDDERALGNGIMVMLSDGWEYLADPGCGTRGFDTVSEARTGTAIAEVRRRAPKAAAA